MTNIILKIEKKNNGRQRRSHSPAPQRGLNQNQNQNLNQIKIHFQIRIHRIPHPSKSFHVNDPQSPEIPHAPQLNWSHLKPKYSGKPDKDVEVH